MESIMKKPIYIDTDMGVDDIIAILMMIESKSWDIRGISIVNGVAPVDCGVRNLDRILRAAQITIPIYRGATGSAQRPTISFPRIDRERAKKLLLIPKFLLPKPRYAPVCALNVLQKEIKNEQSKVTLLCLGPLTNIISLISNRTVKRNIDRLVVMGGALDVPGIVPPWNVAEYNMRLDPQSAQSVFRSGIPITLVPIDATRWVPALNETGKNNLDFQKFFQAVREAKPTSSNGKIIQSIILNNQGDFRYFYDPVATAVILEPALVAAMATESLTISLKKYSLGQLIRIQKRPTITVVTKIYPSCLYTLILNSIYTTKCSFR